MKGLQLPPHSPEILSSSVEARAVVLGIPAGESLKDHQVHERVWVSVLEREVEITTNDGERAASASGLMVEFAPGERHAVRALTTARLLLRPRGRATAIPGRCRSATRRRSGSARPSTERAGDRRPGVGWADGPRGRVAPRVLATTNGRSRRS